MRRGLLVLFLSAITLFYFSNAHTSGHSKHIVVCVPGEHGHVNGVLPLATELKRRGHVVSFVFFEEDKHFIEGQGFDFITAGESPVPKRYYDDNTKKFLETADPFQAMGYSIRTSMVPIYEPIYRSLYKNFTAKMPDLIITDVMQYAAHDISDVLNIPLVYISPTVSMLGHFLPPTPHIPSLFSSNPDAINPSSHYEQIANLFFPYYIMGRMLPVFLELQNERTKCGIPISIGHPGERALVLVPSVWGLEIARPVPPNVKLVGNMNIVWPLPKMMDPRALLTHEWISATDTPVLYVSLGSAPAATESQLFSLYEGLALAHMQLNIRVLWALGENQKGGDVIIEHSKKYKQGIRIESWVDQKRVLNHKNVLYFFSHGGSNSVMESLSVGKPMIVMPYRSDQPGNAALIVHAGAGVKISAQDVYASKVVAAIRRVHENANFTKAAEKIARLMKEAGGVKRAADLTEDLVTFGITHLLHPTDKTPNWIKLTPHALVAFLLLLISTILKAVVKFFIRKLKVKKD